MSNESWRPKLHVAPHDGSISDPNGLCQFKGTYHFFCQNAPTYPPDVDSPHGWGHFASRDLVNWTFLGCHIMPDFPGDRDGAYSGGAYINEDTDEAWFYYTGNVRDGVGDGTYSGRDANQTLMKSYNGINMGQKQVVLDNSGYPAYCSNHVRDPKVWEQDGALHMLLGARVTPQRGAVLLYKSDDGRSWELEGSATNRDEAQLGYMWECPNVVQLPDKDGQIREFLFVCPQGVPKQPFKFQNIHNCGYFPVEGKVIDLTKEKVHDVILHGIVHDNSSSTTTDIYYVSDVAYAWGTDHLIEDCSHTSNSRLTIPVTVSGNTMQWYGNSAHFQRNLSGVTYHYTALG